MSLSNHVSPKVTRLQDLIREHVLTTLESFEGSREATYRALGISRRGLTDMLKRFQKQGYEVTKSSRKKFNVTNEKYEPLDGERELFEQEE